MKRTCGNKNLPHAEGGERSQEIHLMPLSRRGNLRANQFSTRLSNVWGWYGTPGNPPHSFAAMRASVRSPTAELKPIRSSLDTSDGRMTMGNRSLIVCSFITELGSRFDFIVFFPFFLRRIQYLRAYPPSILHHHNP